MDSIARLMSSNENAHTIQPLKNATMDLQTPRKGVLFAFKDVTNNKASSSSTFDNLKSAKKSTPFGNKSNKPTTPDSIFSLGPASPNLSNIPSSGFKFESKLTPEIAKSVNSFVNENFYADPDEFNFPKNGDCACCGSNRKSAVDKMYDEFMDTMFAVPMLPTFEREIFSPIHMPDLEYVDIEDEFPFTLPDPIPAQNYPTFNYTSHSIGSTEYEHESDDDELSSDNQSNYSMPDFEHNFSEMNINHESEDLNEDLHESDQYETFIDDDLNNSMPNFELNFSDDSINPASTECLDSSFTGEW
ncbi:unnamed protein product [Diamesa hyperborea]